MPGESYEICRSSRRWLMGIERTSGSDMRFVGISMRGVRPSDGVCPRAPRIIVPLPSHIILRLDERTAVRSKREPGQRCNSIFGP